MRTQPGQHLSQAGVRLARRVGEGRGPFDLVVTSPAPRAFETAIAMGFAVDFKHDELDSPDVDVFAELAWSSGFAAFVAAVRQGGMTARFGEQQAAVWRSIVQQLPDDGRALVVTHGGFIEAATAALLPAKVAGWGTFCNYCEGALLTFAGEECVSAVPLRVDRE